MGKLFYIYLTSACKGWVTLWTKYHKALWTLSITLVLWHFVTHKTKHAANLNSVTHCLTQQKGHHPTQIIFIYTSGSL